jgi:predicted methyltransferase
MRRRDFIAAGSALAATAWLDPRPALADDLGALLDAAIAGPHRSDANRARDAWRHPKETLQFFGLDPAMTVVEVWPAAGWFTELLAPVLKPRGKLYAARFAVSAPTAPQMLKDRDRAFLERMAAAPDIYGGVTPTELLAPQYVDGVPAGTADLVVTFRNVHNWAKGGYADAMFQAFAAMLKPGGILGVEEHRARPGTPFEEQVRTGYMTEMYVAETAAKAGFRLVGKSEINANPRDTKDWPGGVWTLPPTLRNGDKDRERYLAIGESDRMTLKFRKA